MEMMMEICSLGKTMEVVVECLKLAPIHPDMISAIKSASNSGCELWILSDANAFFIETILKHHGFMDCLCEINIYPSFVDESGRLRILPYHDFNSSRHGYIICPPNMWKGMVIEGIRACFCGGQEKDHLPWRWSRRLLCRIKALMKKIVLCQERISQSGSSSTLIHTNPILVKSSIRQ